MRAAIIRQHGGLDAIKVETVPDPEPGPGEALIRVKACALNHMDLWARKGIPGFAFPLPLIPGCDLAGEVVFASGMEAGTPVVVQPGVSCGACAHCLTGHDMLCRHYGILGETQNGGCAQLAVVPRANLMPKPERLSWEEAAAYPLTFLTAWHMLVSRAGVKPGDTVLVHAAGSGVSSAAIQIARLHGARVIVTAGAPHKLERALALGAAHAIDYTQDLDWSRTVKSLTDRRGVDIAIDHVGAATFDGTLKALAKGGRYVICGATTGGEVTLPLQRLFFKNLAVLGSTMGSKGELHRITQLMAQGVLKPQVHQVLDLEEVQEAHRVLESRLAFGKVVLSVG
ncbi:MAG: NADPH:quinone reductase-like Zn-dependent oxidoreductase [Myxococcota bacterium]|jgi:NADPH:quinone reductase-like Zn-dependent oxidoreductase